MQIADGPMMTVVVVQCMKDFSFVSQRICLEGWARFQLIKLRHFVCGCLYFSGPCIMYV